MTISAAGNRVIFNCDGTTKVFPVLLQAYLATDFIVMLTAGTQSVLVLNSDYSLSPSGTLSPTYWTLTTLATSAYPLGSALQIFVSPAQVQQTQYVQGQAFPSAALQANLDRLTQIDQREQDQINRAIRAPDGDVSPAMLLPIAAQRALTNLGFDLNGNLSLSQVLASGTLSAATIGAFINPQTAAEGLAGVVPQSLWIAPGNVRRYGTNTIPGTTDMTAAFLAALGQAGQTGGAPAYVPAGTYLVSSKLTVSANTQFYGDGSSSIITTAFATDDLILAQNVANVSIRRIKITHTATVTGSYVATIALRGVSNSTVEGCEITGGYFIGIYVVGSATNAAVNNRIVGNYCHSATNTIQDSTDIKLDSGANFGASYNVVDGNQCFGGGNWMGIAVEASQNPNLGILRNIICNNRVGAHTCYGIILYTHTAGDTYNQVIGNYVEGITGTSLTGSGGTGIYVASMSAVTVANNTVVNCCNASSAQFNQGGITILSGFVGSANVVTGNSVYDMCQGNANTLNVAGINIISTPPGTVVSGNLVSQQTGLASIGYSGIEVQGGNAGCTVTGNTINILNTISGTRGIFGFANGAAISNLTITGNTVLGCSSRGVSLEQTGGFTIINFTVTGNTVTGGGAASVCINITTANLGSVSGNTASATTTNALIVSAATNTTVSGNTLLSTGSTAVSLSGTCTGSLFDDSNNINGVVAGGIANSATGMQAKQRTAGSPGALTFASVIGDMSTNTAGATPWGWQCSATGTPGTWVALTLP